MQKRLRFAHIEGYTDVTYTDDGQFVYYMLNSQKLLLNLNGC